MFWNISKSGKLLGEGLVNFGVVQESVQLGAFFFVVTGILEYAIFVLVYVMLRHGILLRPVIDNFSSIVISLR